jgi:hypothetical protein
VESLATEVLPFHSSAGYRLNASKPQAGPRQPKCRSLNHSSRGASDDRRLENYRCGIALLANTGL